MHEYVNGPQVSVRIAPQPSDRDARQAEAPRVARTAGRKRRTPVDRGGRFFAAHRHTPVLAVRR
jgi:hypothetical protein